LDKRLINHCVHPVVQVLAQWSSAPASMATWEDLEALRQWFPLALAWGQLTPKEGGDATAVIHDMVATGGKTPKDEVVGQARSRRNRWPNRRVFGSEWCA
jgi:hypothetical protein